MSTQNWKQVWEIFETAIQLQPRERPAFVQEACGGDAKLRQAVLAMLAADEEADSLLDQPVGPIGSGGIDDDETLPQAGAQALSRGTKIGPYEILRQIGQGGMGTVYLARRDDDTFQRRVVVKLVRPGMESEALLGRLRTERQILAGLDHPYIARLYDGGTTREGLPYFVLEYVEGEQIDAYCEQNRLTLEERLVLFRKVCEAVHYAHQNLVVHRDLKPSNILVAADGDPKLLDFGIAKLLNPELALSGLEPTSTWHRVLTPNYASPEQIRGKMITTASDVYSLGVLLYKLLTGHLPYVFTGRSAAEIERILTETEPPAPSLAITRQYEDGPEADVQGLPEIPPEQLQRQLAGDLDAIVLKALRSSARRRYSSVEQFAVDLERYQRGQPVEARAGSWGYRAGKFVRRNRRAVTAVTGVALLVVGFAVAMAIQAARVARERDQARIERDKKAQVLSLVLDLFEHSNPFVVPGEELTVREALERSVPVFKDGLREQPDVRAELLHTSGSILGVLGSYDAAREQLEEALEIRRDRYGDDHPDVAESLSAVASVYKEDGELDQAEELARLAVDIARRLPEDFAGLPGEHLVQPLTELVSVMCYRNEYEAAAEHAVQALNLSQQLPAGSNRRIHAIEHLGRVRSAQDNHREAVKLYREALALRRARDGEKHPAQITTLNNLGLNLRHMEEFDAAENAYRQAVSLHRENFGDDLDDPYLLNNLGGLYLAKKEFESAEKSFREAHKAVMASSGSDHWMVLFFELRIASAQIGQGAYARVESNLRGLLKEWRAKLGDHWRLAVGESLLGESLSALGRCEEAEPLLVASFERLVERSKGGATQSALDRLRGHFERCGDRGEIERFEALLESPRLGG